MVMVLEFCNLAVVIGLLFGLVTSSLTQDWLVDKVLDPVTFTKSSSGTWRLQNGLMYREFITDPNFMTVDYYSMERDQSLLRALNPEAQITLDGVVYNIGSVNCDIPRAYLNRTALRENMKPDPGAFQFHGYSTRSPVAPFSYTPKRGAPKDIVWPPKGLRVDIEFRAPASAPSGHRDVAVFVHYEMYVGMPVLAKWVSTKPLTQSAADIEIAVLSVEYLSVNEQWGSTPNYQGNRDDRGWLYVETDQSHGTAVTWGSDPATSLMPGSVEPVVNCSYDPVPRHIKVGEDGGFESFRVHELLVGSSDPERSSLARHRMFRTLAPHTQENPIFFHMTASDSASVRALVDQMVQVGFEMMIYSLNAGFNLESTNATYIEQVAQDIAYAKSKGIEVGGYDMIVLDRKDIPDKWQTTDPITNKTQGCACMASTWYDHILTQMLMFIERTGLSMVETDGPYGGEACGSRTHAYHVDTQDSIYQQQKLQGRMFRILQERGVYINQPDYFFYQGGSRTGLGYSEEQYSLPRWQDLSLSRQDVYDDTYRLIPTAGWMITPLINYWGSGPDPQFEPLQQHLVDYEWALATFMGAGVASCYRGYRLYDSPSTRSLVKKWVDFYKAHRDIVTSDIVHIRRPDMQSIDSFMHVNPYIENKALVMVFNPTTDPLTLNLTVPLYYAGLTAQASVSREGAPPFMHTLDRWYSIHLTVALPPRGLTWYLIK